MTNAQQREYEVRLEHQPEGGFTVFVPELPDVITEGETREEALAMATWKLCARTAGKSTPQRPAG
ncbi:MAG: type II toxin-antitoxin system HicB family antitoxin [Mycobacteriales bacterium]